MTQYKFQDSDFFKTAGITPEKGKDPETGKRFRAWAKVVTGINNDPRGGGFRFDGDFVDGKAGVDLDASKDHVVLVHGHMRGRYHYALVKVTVGGNIVPVGIKKHVGSKERWADEDFLKQVASELNAPAPAVQSTNPATPLKPTIELTPGADAALAKLRPYYRNRDGGQIADGGIAHAAFSLMGALFEDEATRNALFAIMQNQGGNVNDAVTTAVKAFASSYGTDESA